MAKPNYSAEKRRKELEKRRKKEAKKLRKLENAASDETGDAEAAPAEAGESPQ